MTTEDIVRNLIKENKKSKKKKKNNVISSNDIAPIKNLVGAGLNTSISLLPANNTSNMQNQTSGNITKQILTGNPLQQTTTSNNPNDYTYFGKTYGDYDYTDFSTKGNYKIYKKDNNYYYYDEKNKKYISMFTPTITNQEQKQKDLEDATKAGKSYDFVLKEKLENELKELEKYEKNNPTMTTYQMVKLNKDKKKLKEQLDNIKLVSIKDRLDLDSNNLTEEQYTEYGKDIIRKNEKSQKEYEEKNRVKKDTPGIDRLLETGKKVKNIYDTQLGEPLENFWDYYETGKKQNELALEYYKDMEGKENKADELQKEMDLYSIFNQDLINNNSGGAGAIKNLNTQVEALKQQGVASAILAGGGMLLGGAIAGPSGAATGAKVGAKVGYALGSTPHTYKLEAGNEYKELIDMGVDKETARKYSRIVGGLNAAIESGENALDLLTFGAASKASNKAAKEVAKKAAKEKTTDIIAKDIIDEIGETKFKKYLTEKFGEETANMVISTAITGAISYGQNIISESAEESSQELVSILGERLATNEVGIDRNVGWDEDLDRIINAGVSAAVSTALTGPAFSIGGSIITNSMNTVRTTTVRNDIVSDTINNTEQQLGRALTDDEKVAIQEKVDYALEEAQKQQANINNAIKTGQLSTNGLNLVDSYKAYHGNDGNLNNIKETQTMYDKRGIEARVDGTQFINSNDVSFWETRDGKQYVVINPKADSNAIFQDAAVHELSHDIFAQKTKLGNTIKVDVLEHVKNDKQYSKLRAEIEEKYSNRYAKDENYEAKIDEEVVAKYLGTNLGTQEYISRLVGEKPNLAQRIYNWVKDKVDNIGKTNEYKQEKAYWKSVADKFEVAYNEQKKNIKVNDVRYNVGDVVNKSNYKELGINEKYLNSNKEVDYSKVPDNLVPYIAVDEGKTKYLDYTRNPNFYEMDIKDMDTAIKLTSKEALLSQKANYDTGVSNDFQNFYLFDIINKENNSFSITDVIPIKEAIGEKYERIRQLSRRTGRDIDGVIRNYNELEQKNSSMHNINDENNNTNKTNDRVFNPEQRQQNIDEPGQTITKSQSNNEDVNNTSFSLKQKQLDIIKKNNPVNDDYHTWIRNIDDIKSLEETLQDEDWADYDEINPDLSKQDLLDAIDKGKITVYSSYPIEQGIFVSPSKMEAQSYSGDGKVYSKEVNINDVAWIDPTQGQYAKIDDTNKMYSSKTTDIAPVTKGTRTTMGELFNKNIAPIREDISNLSNQLNNLSNQIQILQNGAEMTSNEDIAPYNPYRARALEQREANKYYDELQKDENYWKSLEEFANENSDLDAKSARKLSRDVSKEFGIKPARDLQNIIQTAFDEANSINEIRDNIENTLQQKYDTKTIEQAATYIYNALQETLYENAMKQQNDLENQALQYNENLKEIPIKKKTRQEVRENLQNTMGITTDDLQAGNDIKSFSYQTTTPERVNEKVFGREVGRKINEQTVYFAKHQEAERIRFLNKERQEIKDLGIKARSKESALAQQYGEGIIGDTELAQEIKDKLTQEKIKNAARVLRSKYDTYLDQINEELVEMGYDPIPKRKDYMRHFQELTDKFSQAGIPFNRQELNSENLPTDINGLTEFNVPGKNWFASAQRRTGEKTTYDAITGIDGYLEGASNLMFHTETIQRYRALEKLIRDTYGQTHGLDVFGDDLSSEEAMQRIQDIQEGKLSNYAAWLKEQGNAIAGKKGAIDRGVERALGRKGYTFLNTLKKQTGSNMTGLNPRTALTNFISSTIAAAKTNKIAFAHGTFDTIQNIFHRDNFETDFLVSRFGSDSLSQKFWQKVSNAGQIFMKGSDWFTSNLIVRSKYYEGIQKGMTDAQAKRYADDFAARVMGDRSKGATAEAFNSKTLGLFTQFQLETNNQWQYMIHDTKMEFQENLAKDGGLKAGATMLFQMGQLAAYSYLFNEMFEKLTGSRAAFDIADIFKKLFGLDDDDKDKDIETRMQEAASELMDALPFTSLFGSGGRLPIGEMLTPAQTIYDAFVGNTNKYGQPVTWEEAGKEVVGSIPYYVLPTGYGQIKKTTQGLGMYANEVPGSYTDSGNLRFTADTDTGSVIKNALFGQWSGEEAKKYRESGYKTIQEKDIPLMNDLNMSSSEFRDFKSKLNDETTTSKKIDGVNYSLYLDNRGNKYWYDKESKIVFDDDMNKTNKKVLDLEKASANELKYNYVSNLPISENNKQKIFDELFTNTIEDKYGYKKYTDKNNKTYWYDEDNDTLYDSKYNKVNKSSIKGLKEVSESKNMSNYKDYGSYEEFDFAYKNPGKYQTMKAIANDYESYKKYVSGIENVRNKYSPAKGYTTEQRKKKVISYVNKLDLTIPQKAMLLRQYYTSFKDYNRQIVNYVSNLDLTYNEKVEILKSLDMKVDKKGNVTWK